MGKRVKWFNEEERAKIKTKLLDFIQYFEPGRAKDKSDQDLT